jgi:hypothetical protein
MQNIIVTIAASISILGAFISVIVLFATLRERVKVHGEQIKIQGEKIDKLEKNDSKSEALFATILERIDNVKSMIEKAGC